MQSSTSRPLSGLVRPAGLRSAARTGDWDVRRRTLRVTAVGLAALLLLGTNPAAADDVVGDDLLARPGVVVQPPPDAPAPPALPAACYLVADLDTGDVVISQCAHSRGLPASTIKTLTALALQPRLDPRGVVQATNEDAAAEGTKVGLVPGQGYTVEHLLGGLLVGSGNDAANALARAAGGMPTATAAMNELAAQLGAVDTRAVNTSGLDHPDQLSSVYDLALFGRAALRNPHLAAIVSTKRMVFPGRRIKGGHGQYASYELTNHNALLFNCPGTIGVKNGYTDAARHTLIAAVRRHGRGYLLSYLGMDKRDWKTPTALVDWAFTYGARSTPVGRLVEPGTVASPAPQAAGYAGQPAGGGAVQADPTNPSGQPSPSAATGAVGRGSPDPAQGRTILGVSLLVAAAVMGSVSLRMRAASRRHRTPRR